MRHIKILISLVVILWSSAAFALPSAVGGTGLFVSRSADVPDKNQWNLSLFGEHIGREIPDQYGYPIKSRGENKIYSLFNWAVIKGLSLGVEFPYMSTTGMDVSNGSGGPKTDMSGGGMGNVKMIAKGAVNPDNKKFLNAGGTVWVGAPTAGSEKTSISSGETNYGFEGNFTLGIGNGTRISLNANLGYEKSDYMSDSHPRDGYIAASKIVGSGGVELGLVKEIALSLEAVGTDIITNNTQDKDLYSVVGVRFVPISALALSAAGGIGLPDKLRANTDVIVKGGVSYLFEGEKQQAGIKPVVSRQAPKPVTKPLAPKPAVVAPKPVAPVPVTKQVAPKKSKMEMRLEVLNSCDQSNLDEEIAKELLLKGFNVVNMGKSPTQGLKITDIALKKQYAEEAKEIAAIIPDKQTFSYLPDGAEVEMSVRVGCEQRKGPVPAVAPQEPKAVPMIKKKPITDLAIELQNGCGVPGLGEKVAKAFLLAGYNVVKIGNAPKFGYKTSEMHFDKIYADEAKKISGSIKGSPGMKPEVSMGSDAEVIVIIGCDQQ
jgi:hypothetical protein